MLNNLIKKFHGKYNNIIIYLIIFLVLSVGAFFLFRYIPSNKINSRQNPTEDLFIISTGDDDIIEPLFYSFLPIVLKTDSSLYVSPLGSDSNPGTRALPWKTISRAANSVKPGDTVIIRGGIYNEAVNFRTSGTELLPIKIFAYPGETPIIEGNNQLPVNYSGLVSVYGDWVQVSGLEIRNSKYSGLTLLGKHDYANDIFAHHSQKSGIYISGDYGVVEHSRIWRNSMQSEFGKSTSISSGLVSGRDSTDGLTEHAIMRNNISWENWGQGINTYEFNGTIMEDNISHDNFNTNIYISDSTNVLCQRNFVYMNSESYVYETGTNVGIMIGDEVYKPHSENIKVINNIAYGNQTNFALWKGIKDDGINNILIANNTFVQSIAREGVVIRGYHTNVRFENNIIQQDELLDVISISLNPDVTFSNNLWSKFPPLEASSAGDVIGNPMLIQTGSPFFADWFRLNNNSPAINAALNIPEVTIDYFGKVRNNAPEIGAIESFP